MAEIKEHNNILNNEVCDSYEDDDDENIILLRDVDENAIIFMKIKEEQKKLRGI